MPDKKNLEFFVDEWVNHAVDDELNIRSILKHRDGTPANVCFLSQQMSEKYLKALILHYTGDYPKTHILDELAAILHKHIPNLTENLKEDIILLNDYYVGTRYPADIPLESFTWQQAEQAYKATTRIKEFVLEKLK
ncbi:MAG: HEPN domain-containing protein [Patescibacteria group bacterium]